MIQYYRGYCESELEYIENAIDDKELELQQNYNQNIATEHVIQNSVNNSGNSSGVTTPVTPDTPVACAVSPSQPSWKKYEGRVQYGSSNLKANARFFHSLDFCFF